MAVILKNKNKPSIETIIQLSINLALMYISNKISIDIWRSMTGH